MSKKINTDNDPLSYPNFWTNFLGCNLELEDEENDEDYCFVEDKIENFSQYKNDIIPYDFSIPKKEIDDILHDGNNILSINSRKRNKNIEEDINHNNENISGCSNLFNKNIQQDSEIPRRKHIKLKKIKIKNQSKINKNKLNLNISSENESNISDRGRSLTKNCNINLNKKHGNFISSLDQTNFNNNNHSRIEDTNNNMSYSNNNYRSLPNYHPNPNNINYNYPGIKASNIYSHNNLNRVILSMDTPELLKLLLKQFDLFLQILIQNVLLTTDQSQVYRCYAMLYSFYSIRQRILNNLKIPEFGVKFNFCRIFNQNKEIKLHPQYSFFQAPILDILSILVKFIKKSFSVEEVNLMMKEFFPFMNPFYLPMKLGQSISMITMTESKAKESSINIIEADTMINLNKSFEEKVEETELIEKNQNILLNRKRKKFDHIYDNLLMIGLLYHGKKNVDVIQQLWVNSRSTQEIRHRIKNLTCRRAPENIIKKWKTLTEVPLTREEFFSFIKGLQWFGVRKRWNVISKYFLPERSPEYLERVYEILVNFKVFSKNSHSEHNNIHPSNTSNIEQTVSYYERTPGNLTSSMKKKKLIQNLRELTSDEKLLLEYCREFESEIMNVVNFNEISKRNIFYTQEQTFEKFEIESFNVKDRGNINNISTRSRHNTFPYYNSLPLTNKFAASNRAQNSMFDFHIKKVEESSYEKIVID